MSQQVFNTAGANDPASTIAERSAVSPISEDQGEWLLDESLAETFPASDPISPADAGVAGGCSRMHDGGSR